MKRLSVILALSLMTASFSPASVMAAETSQEAVTIEAAAEEETGGTEESEKSEAELESEAESESAEVGMTDETGETAQIGATDEIRESAGTGVSDETGESEEIGVTDETGESEEIGVMDETGESAEIGVTDETGESEGLDPEKAAEIEPEIPGVVDFAEGKKAAHEAVLANRKVEKDSSGNVLHVYYAGALLKNSWEKISFGSVSYDFYFDANGNPMVGWRTVDGGVRYFADDRYPAKPRGAMLTGFKTISGRRYYLGTDGIRETGFRTVNGRRYYMADDRYPGAPTGAILTGFRTIGGKRYYMADDRYPSVPAGVVLTGFRTISGKRYYMADSQYPGAPTGAILTGFRTINDKRYYMADSRYPSASTGQILTGVRTIGGKSYFFNSSGVMKTGWVRTADNIWGYYTSSGAAGKAGWKQKGSSWFYLRENGRARYGWMTLENNSIFYLDKAEGGKMVSGPARVNGKLYFFDEEGRRATTKGWKKYDGDFYYTYENGTVAVNTWVNGFEVDENGIADMTEMDMKAQKYYSSTSYLILVSRSDHEVGVYREDGDAWLPLRKFSCGDGKPSTPTIEGNFTVGIKMLYFDSGSARCWYATQFCGNYLFHSVLYYQASGPYDVMDGTLGAGVSHGCVRLQIDNARWIYDNIPRGTKVVVYW